MYGIDISNYQKTLDLTKFNFDFAMVKATEGRNNKCPVFETQVEQLTRLNKLIGCYHYARPDLNGTVSLMQEEAANFVAAIRKMGLLGKAILVLDWEQSPTNRYDLAKAWLDKVEDLTGVTPFIYASTSTIRANKSFYTAWPLWVAAWPSTGKVNHPAGIEWITNQCPHDIPWLIWQYTSNGAVNGYSGRVDLDYTTLTESSWDDFATAGIKEAKKEGVIEELTDDMKWAINNGLMKGYFDGTYRPTEPLTRQAAATLLRRLYNLVMN